MPPTAHPYPLQNVLRPDEVRPSLDRQAVLDSAPVVEDGSRGRSVTFPPGRWVDWWTGKVYEGTATVPAPLAFG